MMQENNEFLSNDNIENQEAEVLQEEIIEVTDEDNLEEIIENDSEEASPVTEQQLIVDSPQFVEFNPPKPIPNKENKRGLRIFAFLVAFAFLLTGVATLGYFAGKNSSFPKGNISLNLQSKPQNSEALTAEKVYESLNKSIVGIAVYDSNGIKGHASGVIYSEDGYIITNDHIYDSVPNAKFVIYTYDGNTYDANFIAGDTRSDLAVLKIDASGFYPATFGNSDELKFGEEVVAIGRPNDATVSSSITGGYISFLNRRVSNSTSYASKLIQTDSAINPGSSGGALVNMYGQVIGITSSKLVGDEYEGIGYAIPTTTVKYVVEELIANKTVTSRAKLGISYTEIDVVSAKINSSDITGLRIAEVTEGTPLYGKVNEGDIITEVNGEKILKGETVLDIIEASKPGDKIQLKVFISKSNTYKTIEAELVKAESTSSYKTNDTQKNEENKGGGGTFDFPYGY